ncbi:MAG: ABC transporter substrate-binding protein [Candidatus Tectomicrobia bacterium]|nr:ABC transporter substrate-binding protein [Candidatus Tectomicrobia bacterium]
MTTSFVLHGGNTPFFAAWGTGRYQKEGLDVTIQRGHGSKATISTVFSGKSHFGEAGVGTAIISRSQNANVKEIGMIYHNDQSAVITLKGSGIRTPADFKGRRLGVVAASSTRTIFPAVLRRNGLKESDVTFVTMTPAALSSSLLAGQVDMFLTFAVTAVPLSFQAKAMGREVVLIPYGEHGVSLYGNGIITSDALIEKNPDVVRRFVKATLEAAVWAVEHPVEAANFLLKFQPSVTPESALEQWKTTIRFVVIPESLKTGLGYMERDKMAFTQEVIEEFMKDKLGPVKVKAQDVYTNRFIPGKLVPKSAR